MEVDNWQRDHVIRDQRAEIERLEKEVERMNTDLNNRKRSDDTAIYSAAWNDAIEAAAGEVETLKSAHSRRRTAESIDKVFPTVAAMIRALKRSKE